jgi:hypothetical protein
MEILLLILMFLFGVVVGALGLYLSLKYLQERALKKMMQTMSTGSDDPFALVVGMMNELTKGKRTSQKSER